MAEIKTLARPYAKAAFEWAAEVKALESWSMFLKYCSLAIQDKEVKNLIQNPKILVPQKVEFFAAVGKEWIDEHGKNFLRTLAYHRKLNLLSQIYTLFEILRLRHEKTVAVQLTSAKPLNDEYQKKFETALATYLDQKVLLSVDVDTTLLGGALIRVGDLVIDGSTRGQLRRLTESLGK